MAAREQAMRKQGAKKALFTFGEAAAQETPAGKMRRGEGGEDQALN